MPEPKIEDIKRQIAERQKLIAGLVDKREERLAFIESAKGAKKEWREKVAKKKELEDAIAPFNLKIAELTQEIEELNRKIEERKSIPVPKPAKVIETEPAIETLDIQSILNKSIQLHNAAVATVERIKKIPSKKRSNADKDLKHRLENEEIFQLALRIDKLKKLDEKLVLSTYELEDRRNKESLLQWYIVSDFSEETKKLLEVNDWKYADDFFNTKDIPTKVFPEIIDATNNLDIAYINGIQIQVSNRDAITKDGQVIIKDPKGRFNVLGPTGEIVPGGANLNYNDSDVLAKRLATERQKKINDGFKNIPNKDKWNEGEIKKLIEKINGEIRTYKVENKIPLDPVVIPPEPEPIVPEIDTILEDLVTKLDQKEGELATTKNEASPIQANLTTITEEINKLVFTYKFKDSDLIDNPVIKPAPIVKGAMPKSTPLFDVRDNKGRSPRTSSTSDGITTTLANPEPRKPTSTTLDNSTTYVAVVPGTPSNTQTVETVLDVEWNKYIDRNEVPDDRIREIARKRIAGEALTPRENEIALNNVNKIAAVEGEIRSQESSQDSVTTPDSTQTAPAVLLNNENYKKFKASFKAEHQMDGLDEIIDKLERVPGFNDPSLSEGKRMLIAQGVIDSLHEHVEKEAAEKIKEKMGAPKWAKDIPVVGKVAGLLRGIGNNFRKGYLSRGYKKESLMDLLHGEDNAQKFLNEKGGSLIKLYSDLKLDAIREDDGSVHIDYAKILEGNDRAPQALALNKIATEFSRIPQSWSIKEEATPKQFAEWQAKKLAFDQAIQNMAPVFKARAEQAELGMDPKDRMGGEARGALDAGLTKRMVELVAQLSKNPKAAEELQATATQNGWDKVKGWLSDAKSAYLNQNRILSMILGASTRLGTLGVVGTSAVVAGTTFAGVPVALLMAGAAAGGLVGFTFRGGKIAKEKLIAQAKELRNQKLANKEKPNTAAAMSRIERRTTELKKITQELTALNANNGSAIEIANKKNQLETHLKYIGDKITKGEMIYGTPDEAYARHVSLMLATQEADIAQSISKRQFNWCTS